MKECGEGKNGVKGNKIKLKKKFEKYHVPGKTKSSEQNIRSILSKVL